MKFNIAFFLVAILSITSCGGDEGGGGSSAGNGSGGSTPPAPTDYTDPSVYPVSSTVAFRSHHTGGVFKLLDGSAWHITGASTSSHSTGITTSKVTISLATATTPNPVSGARSEYYLIGEGITPAFFVNSLSMMPSFTEAVTFREHHTGDIFKLSDDSAWQITGASSTSLSTGDITTNAAFYFPSTNAPDPVSGTRGEYYLIGNGINPAFFIRPFAVQPLKKGTVSFSNHYTGDVFLLSDGSAWQIVGSSKSSISTGVIVSNVTIYESVSAAPDPVSGVRSDYYLIGQGIGPAFFIKPI